MLTPGHHEKGRPRTLLTILCNPSKSSALERLILRETSTLSAVTAASSVTKRSLVPAQMADHVPMMISIPPKYAVSQVVGFMKGKSAIHLARVYGERKQNYAGQSF
jgi:uncharacterized protein (DUF111 family)